LLLLLETASLLRCAAYVHHVRGDIDAALGSYAQLAAEPGYVWLQSRLLFLLYST
jgi:hypothetical protein